MKAILLMLILLGLPALASELKSKEAQIIADQLTKSINQKIADIAALEIAAGVAPEDIHINLSQQKRFDSGRFGAILDQRTLGKVISVTPRSNASEIGLRSGDIILSVNDQPLNANNNKWRSELQYTKNNSPVKLTVIRDTNEMLMAGVMKAKYIPKWQLVSSKELLLSGKFLAKYIPEWELNINAPLLSSTEKEDEIQTVQGECGQLVVVNSVSIAPSRSTGLKDIAIIKEIDGKPARDASRYRLPTGSHEIKIDNSIGMQNDGEYFKVLVEANKSYYIAYTTNSKWANEEGKLLTLDEYTGPVIWKTLDQACKM
ncbi:PDZ domain-containing protein [Colwelliaceae bacterium 6471]